MLRKMTILIIAVLGLNLGYQVQALIALFALLLFIGMTWQVNPFCHSEFNVLDLLS